MIKVIVSEDKKLSTFFQILSQRGKSFIVDISSKEEAGPIFDERLLKIEVTRVSDCSGNRSGMCVAAGCG